MIGTFSFGTISYGKSNTIKDAYIPLEVSGESAALGVILDSEIGRKVGTFVFEHLNMQANELEKNLKISRIERAADGI